MQSPTPCSLCPSTVSFGPRDRSGTQALLVTSAADVQHLRQHHRLVTSVVGHGAAAWHRTRTRTPAQHRAANAAAAARSKRRREELQDKEEAVAANDAAAAGTSKVVSSAAATGGASPLKRARRADSANGAATTTTTTTTQPADKQKQQQPSTTTSSLPDKLPLQGATLPVTLTASEAAMALKHGWIQLPAATAKPAAATAASKEQRVREPLRHIVFEDLWRKGYWVGSGSKFGGDFLAYTDDPQRVHAALLVNVTTPTASLDPSLDLVGMARVAVLSRKTLVLAIVQDTPKPTAAGAGAGAGAGAVDSSSPSSSSLQSTVSYLLFRRQPELEQDRPPDASFRSRVLPKRSAVKK